LDALEGKSKYRPKRKINRKTLEKWRRDRRLNIIKQKPGR
jgi:hypothetical protein